ncbi:metalloregulator ArsR/SmtB family transcription factor [Roseococcus sp. SDR]|uniref:ArsR/SmtB family transcription factor n=1 Tax=Roseococcus sp. SDR TaxID=2835532 RepID=UPI001BCFCA8E|nr:metalloregulator ArsR/SmtB family transcription factor [Roseococcus sp. SDR]MBS7791619.1 helix-turn-helix transcriptional regulator [Roseococcus sp. SDR]MBV1846933.1 metalloregulator ArsR/SmtB family transcription factor [Roseococcus sp. SDR]
MSALGCDPEVAAEFLRALAHPMRLRILCRLLDGELAVAGFESELGLRQPNLSQQLAALREAGLVTTRRESKSIIYSLADRRVAGVLEALRSAMGGAAIGGTAATPREAAPAPAKAPEAPRAAGEAGHFALAGWNLAR